jgi:glycosyltransferase involved in cell wall biosynthesis
MKEGKDRVKKRRVLHLIDSEGIYGAERVLLQLLPVLRSMDIDVVLGCLSPEGSQGIELGARMKEKGVPIILFDERRKISLRGLRAIYCVMRECNFDMLHTHGYKATVMGGIAAIFAGKPFITTYHAMANQSDLPKMSGKIYKIVEDVFIRRARMVIAVSKMIKEELIVRGVPEERIRVIYNGIEDIFAGERGKDTKIDEEDMFCPHLVSVGRLVKLKRFDLVLDAIARLKDVLPRIGFSIAGDGPLREQLAEKAADLGILDRIRFLGYVESPERIYRIGDIFILSSDTEGTPLALIEAMSASLGVITTPVGSMREWFRNGEHGLVVERGNLSSMIAAIESLSGDDEFRKRMGMAARGKFIEQFKIENVGLEYSKVYDSMGKAQGG